MHLNSGLYSSFSAMVAVLSFSPAIHAFSATKLLCLVNHERTTRSIPPLTLQSRLSQAANLHSIYQASISRMTHTGRGGSTPAQRISKSGYRWTASGENVAYGYPTEEKVMVAWMNSPGHRANILGKQYQAMGAAVQYHGSTPYWTQDFGAGGQPGVTVNCQSYGGSIMTMKIRGKAKSFWQKSVRTMKRVGRKVLRLPPKKQNQSHWTAPPPRRTTRVERTVRRFNRGREVEEVHEESRNNNNNNRSSSPPRRERVTRTFGRGGGGRDNEEQQQQEPESQQQQQQEPEQPQMVEEHWETWERY